MRDRRLAWFCCGALLLAAAQAEAEPLGFTRDVQPILAARCGPCHGGDKRSGGFTIREYNEMLRGGRSGAAVIPGDAGQSLILQRITGERPPSMPLGGPPLTSAEIAAIRSWIEGGARLTPESEAAKAPWTPKLELTAPPIPESSLTKSEHPVDRFIAHYFEARGLPMPAPVPDAVFARRAYLDIWGLLPTPEQLNGFVESSSPGKRADLIDSLLANNRNYTEHWISFWNDLLRNDGGDTYAGSRKSITDWLYPALEANLSYDRFVSDLLNPSGPAAPAGFLLGVNWRGDVNASQTPVMQAAQNSAQVFLGINLKCNSCHDSFISRWKLKDAYGLAAYFADRPKLELVRCDRPTGEYTTAGFLYPELNTEVPEELDARRAVVAKLFTDPRNGRTPRTLVNRYWQRLLGQGIVLDVDDLDAEPWNPELLDWLAGDFAAHGYDLKRLIRTIMVSQAYQMPAIPREPGDHSDYVFRGPEFRRITAEQFIDAVGEITGEWEAVAEPGKKSAAYTRDWRVRSTSLSRALGRPIRDQVFTERDRSATTLQSLELVNGEVLAHQLSRGADRMLGQLKPSPENLFDSGKLSKGHEPVEIDISQLSELRLVVDDAGSYSPERVLPVWADAMVEKDGNWIALSEGPIPGQPVQMKGASFSTGIRAPVGSDLVVDLRGKGYTRFRAITGLEQKCLQDDISPSVRFFIFSEKPDREHMVRMEPSTPVPAEAVPTDPDRLVTRLWLQVLGRAATPAERKLAREALVQPGGLADLIWSLMMLPEFQLIG